MNNYNSKSERGEYVRNNYAYNTVATRNIQYDMCNMIPCERVRRPVVVTTIPNLLVGITQQLGPFSSATFKN